MQTAGASTLTPPGQPTDANGNAMALKKVAQTIRHCKSLVKSQFTISFQSPLHSYA